LGLSRDCNSPLRGFLIPLIKVILIDYGQPMSHMKLIAQRNIQALEGVISHLKDVYTTEDFCYVEFCLFIADLGLLASRLHDKCKERLKAEAEKVASAITNEDSFN
jgi:hypothetical protein